MLAANATQTSIGIRNLLCRRSARATRVTWTARHRWIVDSALVRPTAALVALTVATVVGLYQARAVHHGQHVGPAAVTDHWNAAGVFADSTVAAYGVIKLGQQIKVSAGFVDDGLQYATRLLLATGPPQRVGHAQVDHDPLVVVVGGLAVVVALVATTIDPQLAQAVQRRLAGAPGVLAVFEDVPSERLNHGAIEVLVHRQLLNRACNRALLIQKRRQKAIARLLTQRPIGTSITALPGFGRQLRHVAKAANRRQRCVRKVLLKLVVNFPDRGVGLGDATRLQIFGQRLRHPGEERVIHRRPQPRARA